MWSGREYKGESRAEPMCGEKQEHLTERDCSPWHHTTHNFPSVSISCEASLKCKSCFWSSRKTCIFQQNFFKSCLSSPLFLAIKRTQVKMSVTISPNHTCQCTGFVLSFSQMHMSINIPRYSPLLWCLCPGYRIAQIHFKSHLATVLYSQ